MITDTDVMVRREVLMLRHLIEQQAVLVEFEDHAPLVALHSQVLRLLDTLEGEVKGTVPFCIIERDDGVWNVTMSDDLDIEALKAGVMAALAHM